MKQCIWSCLELIIYTFHCNNFHCNNFQFNYWALCCYAYVVIFHLYLTLMFIDEDGFCYFIPLNAFRDYLQQSTSPIFSSFMDLQALGRNFIRPSFSELVLVGMLSDGSSTLCYAQGRLFICLIHSNYGLFGCLNHVFFKFTRLKLHWELLCTLTWNFSCNSPG